MTRSAVPDHRDFIRIEGGADDRASCVAHAVAFVVTVGLVTYASDIAPEQPLSTGFLVFAVSMMLMYLSSTLLHASAAGPWAERLERLDRASIHFFIAG